MVFRRAETKDLKQILILQHLAYQSEAERYNDYTIQPLTQTLEDVEQEFLHGILLKAVDDDGIIIGSVRCAADEKTCYVGKLMVHPEYQGKGIGSGLLLEIEKACPRPSYELFAGSRSIKNIRLYEKMGYVRYKETAGSADFKFVYLEKVVY